ncbi:hypothetical protein ACQPW1_30205 [Nocardia sp. CA-128927]|uniref:hypothetical protein n=1 Tax=Nocardia sp. CA-128927 TaxID=3239975 RepID=UPI003D954C06
MAQLGIGVVTMFAVTGCVSATNADPEYKTFVFDGAELNVDSHGTPTDLVQTDRTDIRVTRWFDTKAVGSVESGWELTGGTLSLVASCTGLALCDAKFQVEVPGGLRVLRDGRQTELTGNK